MAHAPTQVRANALLEVGGSPTWTLTEDYALGMQLKKYGWHCRYVQEYLAIGEAPDQIRNCYQQRSRWCKVRQTSCSAGRSCALETASLCTGACMDGAMKTRHDRAQVKAGVAVMHALLAKHACVCSCIPL